MLGTSFEGHSIFKYIHRLETNDYVSLCVDKFTGHEAFVGTVTSQ